MLTDRFIRQVMNLDGFGEGPGGTDELAIGVEGKGKAVEYQFVVSPTELTYTTGQSTLRATPASNSMQTLLARVPRTGREVDQEIRLFACDLVERVGGVEIFLQVPKPSQMVTAMLFPLYSIINVELPGAK